MKDNEAFVSGRSKEKAQTLLNAAAELNLEPRVVRATDGGYIVPVEIADHLEPKPAQKAAGKPSGRSTRKTSTTKAKAEKTPEPEEQVAEDDNKSQDEEE